MTSTANSNEILGISRPRAAAACTFSYREMDDGRPMLIVSSVILHSETRRRVESRKTYISSWSPNTINSSNRKPVVNFVYSGRLVALYKDG
ncbi:hypothetical protein L596_000906 [Steinernema carpocapsae]|uniref:Uncharacterized protein n=1 Tax=Steinernema carpocapsae TaxID=34508 RepID=A0A4U8UJW5_STECR|nr:hypothetical protein L596_000906 [Steinernema carpocapsae]